jgi:hypothetical protein
MLVSTKFYPARTMLEGCHAENTDLNHKRFCNALRLHHHGEGEKAYLTSAIKRGAMGAAFFNEAVYSWRTVKAARQFLFYFFVNINLVEHPIRTR